jgi:CelD/BcsL family acetyltransferase involved in cellulose biosynthesis
MLSTPIAGARNMHDATPGIDALHEQREALNRRIGEAKIRGESIAELIEESRALSAKIRELTAATSTARQETAEAAAAFSTSVLTSASEVDALRDEWRALLLSASTIASPFMTWEWMMSWYETYEDHGSIRCITVRARDGRLIGILPLFLSLRPDRNLSKRQIGFASTYGHSWGFDLVMLCASDDCGMVGEATLQYLESIRDEWDCVRKLRSTVRQAQQRLDSEQPQHRFACITDPDEITRNLDEYVRLNIRRRAAGHSPSRFLNADCRLFLERSTRRLAEAGWLKLMTLSIGPRIIGIEPFLVYRDRVYLLSPAWAPEYARHSPSHLLFVQAMREGVQEGASEANFLAVGEHYKTQYTRELRSRLDVIVAPSRRGMARLLFGEIGAAALRRLNSKLRPSRE